MRKLRLLSSVIALVVVSVALAMPPKQKADGRCFCTGCDDTNCTLKCCNNGKCVAVFMMSVSDCLDGGYMIMP